MPQPIGLAVKQLAGQVGRLLLEWVRRLSRSDSLYLGYLLERVIECFGEFHLWHQTWISALA